MENDFVNGSLVPGKCIQRLTGVGIPDVDISATKEQYQNDKSDDDDDDDDNHYNNNNNNNINDNNNNENNY